MARSITLLYTQNIRGQFTLLPRLATLIRRLRREVSDKVLLLDMGNSCVPSVPLCIQTEGRAILILMDAIAYDAANVTGVLEPAARAKLADNHLHLALVDADHPFESETGVVYADKPTSTASKALHIALQTKPEAQLMPNAASSLVYTLHLRTLQAGQVGQAVMTLDDEDTELTQFSVHELTRDVLPDPTIAGTLDFVKAEARFYSRRSPRTNNGDNAKN